MRLQLAVIGTILLCGIRMGYCDGFRLAASHPAAGEEMVAVSTAIHIRFSEPLVPETLGGLTLHLAGVVNAPPLPLRRATDLTNASITLAPNDFLAPNTTYEVGGMASVRSSSSGQHLTPFRFRFTTGVAEFDQGQRLVFVPETFDSHRSMTTVLFGPDSRLYAADAFGSLVRWDIDENGRPAKRRVLLADSKKSRQYIDLEWDPKSTADRLVLWISYSERISDKKDPRHFFSGTIARLILADDGVKETRVIVTGLPHGRERQGGFETLPHQPNGLVFRGGKLYQSVGSTSSSGGPPNWGIVEQPLSGCILEIDYREIHGPLDVYPGTGFDPNDPKSPLRIFATGVRNALEIVAHSNGRLYTAVNINDRQGRRDGVPDDPEIPGDQNRLIKSTTPDHESLYILQRDRHYGFPNPARHQFVLNGGNPTAESDPFEIIDYPVGTAPEAGYAPELMYPIWQWGGTSPNGMLEYKPTFDHPLAGTLICCFYSAGDLAVLTLGSDGLPTAIEKLRAPGGKKLSFAGPLDITLDRRSGILYVADFGKQSKFGADGSMLLLRPKITAPRQ